MMRPCYGCIALLAVCAALRGCGAAPQAPPLNPFRDLPPVALDGIARELTADMAPLGPLDADDVIRVRVDGDRVAAVLLLIADDAFDGAGVYVGGGPANQEFQYRVRVPGRYFVFVQFDPQARPGQRRATMAVAPGDPSFAPPSRQLVQIVFAEGFLDEPGLFDPVDGTPQDRAFLADIAGQVSAAVLDQLRDIFAGTPIVILGPDDPQPAEPFSRLTFLPDRILADDQEFTDAALPPPDPSRPQCQVRVIYGEVLPRGAVQDEGNRTPDDDAVVYVGSFQGRSRECWTSAVNSLSNVVLVLAQTGAHEIGHLVGLRHVEQMDIMNRSATLALLRELTFARGQIQVERVIRGEVAAEVLTTVIQDPQLYFQANFAPAP